MGLCGPSEQQKELAASEQSFSKILSANYAQNFAAQSQILQNLTNQFTPIAEAGPDQQGFGAQELAALSTQAGEGVAADYAKAQQSLNTVLGSRGGGNEFLPTGAEGQLRATLAQGAASQASQEQLAITRANYAQGRQNWAQATAGLNALAGEYNPNAIAGQATTATQGAFQDATKIQEMQNQAVAGIGGLVASAIPFAGKGIAGGLSNLASGGAEAGSETGGGLEQFFSGGLSALAG